MIRTVTPNPSFDLTYEVGVFSLGEVNRAARVTTAAAGKGVNVARNAVANGFPASAVIPAASADAEVFAAELAAVGVGLDVVDRPESVRRNITITERNGTTTKLNEMGEPLSPEAVAALRRRAAAGDAATVAACGSLPPGVGPSFFAELAEAVREPETRLALDTSGAALKACLDVPCAVVKPNREELEDLIEDRLETYGDLVDVAGDLVRRGWRNVLVSLGPAGAVLVNSAGAWGGRAPTDEVVNTVGAGDALLTGFLCGGPEPDAALASALAFGRATVRSAMTAGAIVSEADRGAVELFPVVTTDSLGEETG